jgi:hypothetical protein
MDQVTLVNAIISKMSVPELRQVANHVNKTAQQRLYDLDKAAANEDLKTELKLRSN